MGSRRGARGETGRGGQAIVAMTERAMVARAFRTTGEVISLTGRAHGRRGPTWSPTTTVGDGTPVVAVVIPCFRVADTIADVVASIPLFVRHVVVVDDASPDDLQARLADIDDARLEVCRHAVNGGVGAAMKTGLQAALALGADVVVKVDGDGQMPAHLIGELIQPLLTGEADMVKGNRFRDLNTLSPMPLGRKVGNLGLSFMVKLASGYWNLFDPTNGFVALTRQAIERLDLGRLASRYFFESSLLIECNVHGLVIEDFAMHCRYQGEPSSLSPWRALVDFPARLLHGLLRRLLLKYFILDFGVISLLLSSGLPLLVAGVAFALWHWYLSSVNNAPATAGTVMVGALAIIFGFQMLLQAMVLEISNVPRRRGQTRTA